jgi:hypothetical protein
MYSLRLELGHRYAKAFSCDTPPTTCLDPFIDGDNNKSTCLVEAIFLAPVVYMIDDTKVNWALVNKHMYR